MERNRELFSAVRQLALPIGHYAITGSGPMGIRNLKEIGDLDLIVSEELWSRLAFKYGVMDEKGVKKITFPGGMIEAFHQGSFYKEPFDPEAPTYAWRIAHAEMFEGLPFDPLEVVLYYKKKQRREKDLKDIELIERWILENRL